MSIRSRIALPSGIACEDLLAGDDSLGFTGRQTLSAIIGNGAVDDGAAIDAFPCIKHEEEIREPLQHHQPLTLRTFHCSLPGGYVHS